MSDKGKTLFMCGTDYEHELGEIATQLYASVDELRAERKCLHECGIVAVRVELVEWVEDGVPYSQRGNRPN